METETDGEDPVGSVRDLAWALAKELCSPEELRAELVVMRDRALRAVDRITARIAELDLGGEEE